MSVEIRMSGTYALVQLSPRRWQVAFTHVTTGGVPVYDLVGAPFADRNAAVADAKRRTSEDNSQPEAPVLCNRCVRHTGQRATPCKQHGCECYCNRR